MQKRLTLVNIREHAALGNGDVAEKFIQLLIIANGKLKMTWDDTCFFIVACGVASQLENLSSQIFKNSSEVDRRA